VEKDISNKHHRLLKREAGMHVRALLIEQKKLKTSHQDDLSVLLHEFKTLYYLGAFLGLLPLCRMALLGLKYTTRLSGSEFPLPREKYQILRKLVEQIVILFRELEEIKDDGYYINHQEAVIRTASHDYDTSELEKMFQKILISNRDDFNVHSLAIGKDKDFSHSFKIPKKYMIANNNQSWNVLVYIDLTTHEDIDKLINSLEILRKSDELALMGPFALPYDYFQESKIKSPFYILYQGKEECKKRLKDLGIEGKIVKILQEPKKRKESIKPDEQEKHNTPREIIREVPFLPPELIEKIDRIDLQTRESEPLPEELDLKKPKPRKLGVRFSIGFKLILIISIIIMTALTTMSVISFSLFQTTLSREIEENSLTVADLLSTNTERSFNNLRETLRVLLNNNRETLSETLVNNYPYIMYFQLISSDISYSYPGFFSYNYINGIIEENYSELLDEAWNGDLNYRRTFNPSFYLTDNRNTDPLTGVLLTYWDEQDKRQKPMIIIVKTSELLGDVINSSGSRTIFILNGKGELIGHPDQLLVTSSQQGDFENHPVLEHVRESGSLTNQQISYKQTMNPVDMGGAEMLGAYTAITDWDLFFISEIKYDVVFGPINDILKQNIYLMIMILSLAILLIYFFSKTITLPMARLMVATKMINRGIFELKLKPRGRDETGVLTQAFVDMGHGLQERERMKDAFGRFVNAEVAEMAARGELKLGGETKEATIFFSDIRAFTAISEKLSPDEVVEFLNEYMTAMVQCVTDTHGHVDKYIGDAIMALWGVPRSHGNDPENCIDCALAMREALIKFNIGRGGDKKPIIKIGCGINSGPVVSGQIGSINRMEYTVIGDAVNLASRVEPLNKPMGTDILISTDTYNHVKGIYDLVPMNKIKVKGKSEPQQIYAVLGRMDNPDRPKNLDEMRAYVGIEGDYSHIKNEEADEKEVKYEIMD
jgi:adenylate cyclase